MVVSVLSGKGGTGKTTIVAALSDIVKKVIKVDCDVDAPNLYLFYEGKDIEKNDFVGGKIAKIDNQLCIHCKRCVNVCKFGAISDFMVNSLRCEGCGACKLVCPIGAITLLEEKTAETLITKTESGIISRAIMAIGSEGSGKLVTALRKNTKRFQKQDIITILDGSPGIGCSVIASITDTDAALIVTEPTRSGLDDLKRILTLAANFDTQVMICINKYDINPQIAKQIEEYAIANQISVVGKIPFDNAVMESVNTLTPITKFKESAASKAIQEMWITMSKEIGY